MHWKKGKTSFFLFLFFSAWHWQTSHNVENEANTTVKSKRKEKKRHYLAIKTKTAG